MSTIGVTRVRVNGSRGSRLTRKRVATRVLVSNVAKRTSADGQDIGRRIERLVAMAEPALSWRELDRLAGLSASHSRAIRAEGWRPEAGTLAVIAGVFGVTMDWLFSGNGEEPAPDAVSVAVAKARADKSQTEARRS